MGKTKTSAEIHFLKVIDYNQSTITIGISKSRRWGSHIQRDGFGEPQCASQLETIGEGGETELSCGARRWTLVMPLPSRAATIV